MMMDWLLHTVKGMAMISLFYLSMLIKTQLKRSIGMHKSKEDGEKN